jgi:hypothetical protein
MVPRRLGRRALAYGAITVCVCLPALAATPQLELRMVIANEVVCRAEPSVSSPVVRGYAVGDVVHASGAVETEGVTWYPDRLRASGVRPACWIHGPLTTPIDRSDPEPALLAVADHVLGRTDDVPFEDYVAVENLLLQTGTAPHYDDRVLASSGLLQLRRLQIVQRAIADPALSGPGAPRAPLSRAWIFAHRDIVWNFEPAAQWVIRPETYWALFEQYRSEPWAEEIAWAAAKTRVLTDECYEGCVLDGLHRTYARYWTSFPRGTFVDEALTTAFEPARYAAGLGCVDGASDRLRQLLTAIRASLDEVTAPGRRALVEQLDAIERACRREPSRLDV